MRRGRPRLFGQFSWDAESQQPDDQLVVPEPGVRYPASPSPTELGQVDLVRTVPGILQPEVTREDALPSAVANGTDHVPDLVVAGTNIHPTQVPDPACHVQMSMDTGRSPGPVSQSMVIDTSLIPQPLGHLQISAGTGPPPGPIVILMEVSSQGQEALCAIDSAHSADILELPVDWETIAILTGDPHTYLVVTTSVSILPSLDACLAIDGSQSPQPLNLIEITIQTRSSPELAVLESFWGHLCTGWLDGGHLANSSERYPEINFAQEV